jgi:hypothetical protein
MILTDSGFRPVAGIPKLKYQGLRDRFTLINSLVGNFRFLER